MSLSFEAFIDSSLENNTFCMRRKMFSLRLFFMDVGNRKNKGCLTFFYSSLDLIIDSSKQEERRQNVKVSRE